MPTINKRFLARLVLVVLILSGILVGAHELQARRIPEALKRQSERAADAGKNDAAIHYLRHYLEFVPDDADAMATLADLLRHRDPSYRGYTDYVFLSEKVLRIDPARHEVRREVLAACLKMGRYSDAAAHAEALLEKFPSEAALWAQLGAAQAGLNQLVEARKSYETAIGHAPGEMIGYQRLAQLLWKGLDKPVEAHAVLDRMIAAVAQEPLAYLARARFESFLADEAVHRGHASSLELAQRDLRRVLELDPENADASLLLAEILQKKREVPAAHAILRDAASLYPRDVRLVRGLAWLELVRGNVPAALAVLEDGLKRTPDSFDLLVPLTDLLVQQGDTARSNEIMERLKTRKTPESQVKYLQARMAMRDEKWAGAIATLESLRAETIKMPGLEAQLNLLLASCFEKTGDPDSQEKAYKRIITVDPVNVPARVGLASVFMNLGRFDDAIREFEAAVQSPYAAGSVHAQFIHAKARRMRQLGAPAEEWSRLERAAASAAAKFGPASSDALVLRAGLAVAQDKYADAIRLLRQETGRRPGDTRLWAALAQTTAETLGTAAGLIVMDEAQASAGDGPEIRLARAALYAREPGRIRPIEPLADGIDTWAEADQLRLLYGLVEVYDRVDDRSRVLQTLRRIAGHRPSDVALWMRLHERARELGNTALATEARMALAKIEGEHGLAAAICDAASTGNSQTMGRLLSLLGPSPNRADACLVLAKWKAETGERTEALRLTERAFTLEPTRYESARAFLIVLCTNGGDERAAKLVARLASDSRWAGDPFRRLIRGVIERLPPETGANVAAWCRPLVEREPGGLGWLAECLKAVGKTVDAEAALVAATQSPLATADDWFRLALHHAEAGRKPAAASALEAARGKLQPPVYFALAAAYVETAAGRDWSPDLGEIAAKRAFAQARLAVKLSRSARIEAIQLLDAFLAEEDLRKADEGWAKRNLAMLLALGGTADDRTRAMELLKNSSDQGASPEDLRATANVLATLARYLESDDRKAVLARAASALEAVYRDSQSPHDLYNLAQIHRAAGNRKAGRDKLNALLKADSQNIYYLTSALEELTEDRNFAAGESFAERLKSRYPGEYRAVAAAARFECKAGKPDRALALAEGYASSADAGAGDYLARAARVAELLDELARYPNVRGTESGRRMIAAAAERYAALVPSRPEAAVGIAGLLAADGNVAGAFASIEGHSRSLPDRVRVMAGLAALRCGNATDRQFAQVKTWLDQAKREDAGSIPLLLNEAEFRTLQQSYAAAADNYEAILKREPRNVVALNNLAWIRAADPATAQQAVDLLDRAMREAGLTGELLDTRARARITLKQFAAAERDLTDAMTQEETALRWFHRALLLMSQSSPDREGAVKAFREACLRGLEPKVVHPSDLPTYRALETLLQK
jgi:cellulose synthase operon protein C